jgi:hypothetical protein
MVKKTRRARSQRGGGQILDQIKRESSNAVLRLAVTPATKKSTAPVAKNAASRYLNSHVNSNPGETQGDLDSEIKENYEKRLNDLLDIIRKDPNILKEFLDPLSKDPNILKKVLDSLSKDQNREIPSSNQRKKLTPFMQQRYITYIDSAINVINNVSILKLLQEILEMDPNSKGWVVELYKDGRILYKNQEQRLASFFWPSLPVNVPNKRLDNGWVQWGPDVFGDIWYVNPNTRKTTWVLPEAQPPVRPQGQPPVKPQGQPPVRPQGYNTAQVVTGLTGFFGF